MNFAAGQTVANAVITPVSADGTVCFYSSAEVDLVVDVNGWLKDVSGYHAITPERLLDTRPDDSPDAVLTVDKAKLEAGAVLRFDLADMAGVVPASGVSAVSINVTATNPEAPGYLTVFPCGTRELVSSVNYTTGRTVPNAVIAPVSEDGEICIFSLAGPTSWSTSTAGSRPSERHRKRGGRCKPSYRDSVICVDIAGVGVAQPDKVLFEGLSLTVSSGDRVADRRRQRLGEVDADADPRRRPAARRG